MTADRATLEGLLARVEAATGPDRGLDWEIYVAIGCQPGFQPKTVKTSHHYLYGEAYTASIDAALALAEWCLPKANCIGVEKAPRSATVNIKVGHWVFEAEAATCALALLAALLRTLLADAP